MFDAHSRAYSEPGVEPTPECAKVDRSLLRLWVARIRPGREDAYHDFAERISRPMFQAHGGCRGVTFLTLEMATVRC